MGVYYVYDGKDLRWLGSFQAGSHPEAAGCAQREYGHLAGEKGLIVSVLPPEEFRRQQEAQGRNN